MVKVRRAWQREAQERGITDIGIEVLPSHKKAAEGASEG